MGLCEDDPVVLRHVGDIAASWVLQVGNQSHPQLRSPLLDRIADVVESKKNVLSLRIIYIGELGLLFTPQSLRRSGEAS